VSVGNDNPWNKKGNTMTKERLEEMLDFALEQYISNLFKNYVLSIDQDYKAMQPFKEGMVKAIQLHKKAVAMLPDIA